MHPANTFVATFVGSPQMNLYSGEVSSSNGSIDFNGAFNLSLGKRFTQPDKGPAVKLGVRPEDVAIVRDRGPNVISGQVILKEPVGSDIFLNADVEGDVSLKVRVPGSFRVEEGDQILLEIKPEVAHLFDNEGLRIAAVGES